MFTTTLKDTVEKIFRVLGATVNLPVTPISHIMHWTTLSERTCKMLVWPRDPFWAWPTMPGNSSKQDQCWFWHHLIPSVKHVSGTRKHNIGSNDHAFKRVSSLGIAWYFACLRTISLQIEDIYEKCCHLLHRVFWSKLRHFHDKSCIVL